MASAFRDLKPPGSLAQLQTCIFMRPVNAHCGVLFPGHLHVPWTVLTRHLPLDSHQLPLPPPGQPLSLSSVTPVTESPLPYRRRHHLFLDSFHLPPRSPCFSTAPRPFLSNPVTATAHLTTYPFNDCMELGAILQRGEPAV